jgi:uncharacterized protein YndB with AHSA1/START domain
MNKTILLAPVRKEVIVTAAQSRAFEVFTARMGQWWLKSHSVVPTGQADVVIEPVSGGRWYEVGTAGETCDWGRVLVWEPPNFIVLAWQLSAKWVFDPNLMTEVEVVFSPAGQGKTRVVLEHRGLEAFDDAAEMRSTFDSANGWAGVLASYVAAMAAP